MTAPAPAADPQPRAVPRLMGLARRTLADPLARGSLAIMATTVITSLFGYVFWLLVSRRFGAAVSGAGAAVTSALQATVLLASVGAAAALVEWLPRSRSTLEWRQRLTAGLLVAGGTAVLAGPLVALALGGSRGVVPLLHSVPGFVAFCVGAVVFAVGTVLDYVAISERRTVTLVLRGVLLTGLRIPLLFVPSVLAGDGAAHLLLTWTVAAIGSLVVTVLGFGTGSDGRTLRPAFGETRRHVREMTASFVGQHLITVAAMLAGYLLPLLVVARVSEAANGYFYITWMLGSIFAIISPAIATSLFSEGATDPATLPALVRRCALLTGGLLILPMLAYLLGGGLLLSLFGPEYPRQGRLLLILLTVSALPDAVTNIGVAVLRVTSRLREASLLNLGMLVLCLAGSWALLPSVGIVAVGGCWLGSQALGTVYVLTQRRRIFGSHR